MKVLKIYMIPLFVFVAIYSGNKIVGTARAAAQHCKGVANTTDPANNGSPKPIDNCNKKPGTSRRGPVDPANVNFNYNNDGEDGGYSRDGRSVSSQLAYSCYTDHVPPRKKCNLGGTQKKCKSNGDKKDETVRRVLHRCSGSAGSKTCDKGRNTNTYFQRPIGHDKCA